MKRLYTTLLLATVCLTTFATVKPRYQGWRADWTPEMIPASEMSEQPMHGPRRVGLHSNAPLTSMGSPKVPVILVQFTDLKFISGLPEGRQCETEEDIDLVGDYYDLFCNGLRDETGYWTEGGSMGAIREYFRDQSNGLFTPDFYVIGPVTLDNGYAYYGSDTGGKDKNLSQFYSDAIKKAQEIYSDWSIFDNNSDNKVDMAFFVFAGPGENAFNLDKHPEAKDYIWPQERPTGGTLGGIQYGCYACCNETYKDKPDGIGVFVHELSHAMGLPDLYDYNYLAYGMDYWDIMDSGCYCNNGYTPCGYSAYEKDFMGWQPLTTLSMDKPEHLVLQPMHAGGQAYKMVNPNNANEYYVLENRQSDSWDTYIGRGTEKTHMHGMLLTHINYVQSSWTSNKLNTMYAPTTPQRCTIIAADGILDSYMNVMSLADQNIFYPSVLGDPFPGYQNVTDWEGTDSIAMPYWKPAKWEPVSSKDSLTIVKYPVAYTGTLDQPLRHIVENADGTVELDYCPRGEEPEPTSIIAFEALAPKHGNDTLYDLQGRRVKNATHGGIYIRNGHKYLLK